jgi:hypothetical protein
MAVLNNVTTQDAYVAATTLDGFPPAARVTIDVYLSEVVPSAVYWQLRVGQGPHENPGNWEDEVFMGPGSRTVSRTWITGVRVRSAKAGKPAQVTIQTVPIGTA